MSRLIEKRILLYYPLLSGIAVFLTGLIFIRSENIVLPLTICGGILLIFISIIILSNYIYFKHVINLFVIALLVIQSIIIIRYFTYQVIDIYLQYICLVLVVTLFQFPNVIYKKQF
ncbi:MAG: hypothetical protein PHD47_00835 [Acholeplasmataceae bacterium]|nr:hypothetical protein [Acholeplasmataceae bacterium]